MIEVLDGFINVLRNSSNKVQRHVRPYSYFDFTLCSSIPSKNDSCITCVFSPKCSTMTVFSEIADILKDNYHPEREKQ